MAVFLFQNIKQASGQPPGQSAIPAPVEKITNLIEARLGQPGGDTASFYIIEKVRNECGKNVDCLRSQYSAAVVTLEQRGKYRAAIPPAEELVKLVQSEGDLKAEATALEKLVMLYKFSENTTRLILHREELILLYERMGNQEGVITNKAIILEGKAWDLREPDEARERMDRLFFCFNLKKYYPQLKNITLSLFANLPLNRKCLLK